MPLADITKTIGTAARDYSTITAWEADLDEVLIYTLLDNAIGVCYNDSVFDEAVTINGGTVVGLASVLLTVAEEDRHDGTAGTGVRIERSTTGTILTVSIAASIEWLELSGLDNSSGTMITNNIGDCFYRNMLIHNTLGTSNQIGINLVGASTPESIIENCILYNIVCSHIGTKAAAGIVLGGSTARVRSAYNCTVHRVVNNNGTGSAIGIRIDNESANKTVINCISTDLGGTTSGTKQAISPAVATSAIMHHNASSDTSASGTGSITSIVSTDQFVSTVLGSEDLHLKEGSDCIDVGTDLGTSPENVNIDIDGRDRDTNNDIWDMGADEFVASIPLEITESFGMWHTLSLSTKSKLSGPLDSIAPLNTSP